MSILRIAANPADITLGAYDFLTDVGFDNKRVSGAFKVDNDRSFEIEFTPTTGTSTWFHCRLNTGVAFPQNAVLFDAFDDQNNRLARLYYVSRNEQTLVYGDGTSIGPQRSPSPGAEYDYDFHLEVTPTTITATFYVNGNLISTVSNPNEGTPHGVPNRVVFTGGGGEGLQALIVSEIIIADEDTRGMRIRELKPTSFGLLKQWDGNIQSLRDNDLATGLSTDTADERTSFGVSNLSNIKDEDLINRVVVQTYAQRGVTGLTAFNNFFRLADGTIVDGADQTLDVLGKWFIEEFPNNPDTGVQWEAQDFAGIQTGIRSRA